MSPNTDSTMMNELISDIWAKTFPQGCGFLLFAAPCPVECLSRLTRREEISYWSEMRNIYFSRTESIPLGSAERKKKY
jgi:hypothetical protein